MRKTGKNVFCKFCGKEFHAADWELRSGRGKYCSKKCSDWRGGKFTTKRGYVHIYLPNYPFKKINGKYVYEHRLVVEKCLGRYLKPEETIHHINGIKSDNRPENLYLFNNHKDHFNSHHPFVLPELQSNIIN